MSFLQDEIDEDEAIQRILDEGRNPTKGQDSSKNGDKVERSRRTSTSSSCSSNDSRSKHRRRRKSRSRSYSRSRSRRSRSRSRHRERNKSRRNRSRSLNREEGEIDSSDDSESDYKRQEVVTQEKLKRKRKKKKGNDYEGRLDLWCSGEIFESFSLLDSSDLTNVIKFFQFPEIAKKYPPSLRIIVIESDKLDVGKLFVVTFKGGTLGREGNHDVIIPDLNVSKNHLKFSYNHKKSIYQYVDRSRNGTLLDGVQTSSLSQEDSYPNDVEHGSVLQLAKTKLLCHIHEGLTTCTECEPYNYVKKSTEEPRANDEPQPSNLSHKEQLKLLQKRYGLATEKYQENPSGATNKNYEDRAEKRRVKVGSSHGSVKTEQASVNTSISSENKGFKLLSKMGWSEGKSIGKSQEGIKEPVQVKTQQGTSGLGSDTFQPAAQTFKGIKKKDIWNKTQERYNSIRKQDENIFGDDDEDDG